MTIYIYEGPVNSFGKEICRRWHGETTASSEAKAVSNLKAQFKREFNLEINFRIELINGLRKREVK